MQVTGTTLKESREKLGLTLQEVSSATKINSKILEAIELGRAEDLPAPTFLRGFVRTYARFLKLDEKVIMESFNEELGVTPVTIHKVEEVDSNGSKSNTSDGPDRVIRHKSPFAKIAPVLAIVLLIGLIVTVRSLVEKYERERVVTIPTDIEPLDPAKEAQVPSAQVLQDQDTSTKNAPVEAPASTAPQSEPVTAETAKPAVETPNPEPKPESAVVASPPKPAEEVKPAEPKPTAVKPVETKVTEAKPTEEKTEAPPAPKSNKTPQELLIEALDNTEIVFQVDGGGKKVVNLSAEQIHIIKAKESIKVTLKDGGAVNLVHNGQDKGVPGDLGKSMSLNFP